ncbi:hypothetical protein [Flavobacterium sp. GT3R68]|uniref:hypothetical protein n=1 Tax=Flavobacterium sp. GT3R68 TaxID=2594437 RepID=UPI000F86FA9E|nr:hypothetical protein [Flavobacterium sp. GT3R68]RTY89365.1 hypothetical protein EKL32_23185 [Flavobacterium sp. GSN2]TRW93925.1 hypothetical protein FNW07_03160 [Flavobacterium sp. GT3R68]
MMNLTEIRVNLIDCTNSTEKHLSIKKFISLFEKSEINNSFEKAFHAVSLAYKAKTHLNPIKKIHYLNMFHKNINEAIVETNNSYEAVFLRHLIQKNIPRGLGFSDSYEKDSLFLKEKITDIDSLGFDDNYKNFIVGFLSKSN